MKKIIIFLFMIICSVGLFAQSVKVTGTVVDDTNSPLPGVNIVVTGSGQGVVTDFDGKYSISLPSNKSTLEFTFIGFQKQQLKLKPNQTVLNVTMVSESLVLDEFVVVGYGSQKKASIVGAVSNIKNEEIKTAAPANLTNAIAGRITGAIVRLGDGNIGGGTDRYSSNGELANAQIFIRGRATTNAAEPLILVDGIESSFANINPEDIAQFSVLKDASATAVYGVRGANGVILITTKDGQLGKPKVSFKAELRRHESLAFPEFLGAYDYATLYNEALKNAGTSPKYTNEDLEHWRTGDDPYGHPDVNWRDWLVDGSFTEQQYSFNLNGGTDRVRYYVSGDYLYAGGPFKGTDLGEYTTESYYKRYNLRTNFDFTVTKSTTLNVKLNAMTDLKNDPNYNDSSGARYKGSYWWDIIQLPVHEFPVYNPDGSLAYGLTEAVKNVYANVVDGGYYQRSLNQFQSNVTLTQKLDFITKGLSFRAMYGNVYKSGSEFTYTHAPALWSYDVSRDAYTLRSRESMPSYSATDFTPYNSIHWETALNYDRTFNKVHKVSLMGIYIQTQYNNGYALPTSYRGVSGRATYGYRDTYLAEFNVGYNGSDKFAKGKRYALLPSMSLGWVISNEPFFKNNVSWVDFLKVRGSYGTAGNDKIGSYKYLYLYQFNSSGTRWDSGWDGAIYYFGETAQSAGKGLREGALGNDNVTWEIAHKYNVGLDFYAFGNKLNFTTDVFLEKRNDILLIRQDIPTQTGLSTSILPAQNAGKVTNKGFEVSASWNDKIGELGYNLGFNYTFARNTIDYIAEVEKKYPWQMQRGHSIGQTFGYTWTGKFYDFADLENPDVPKPTYPVYPGDLMFEDLNGDGIIDDYDSGAIGKPTVPEIVYGFNVGLNYKNVYGTVFFQGAANVSSYYGAELTHEFKNNVQAKHLGRWVYDEEKGLDTRATATYPALRLDGGSTATRATSTFHQINSAYLRVKSVELGYNLPARLTKPFGISAMKVYLNGSNLFTFTDYKYIDPEYTSGSRGPYFPQTKFYSVGLNLNF